MASSKKAGRTPAYRLVSTKWLGGALSGEGARKYGGRWNSPGRPAVYLGSTRSLCALELLVHLPSPGSRRKAFSFLSLELPSASIHTLPTSALPESWREDPPTSATMHLGDDWLAAGSSLALAVPSAIMPEEWNFLLNPLHPDFHRLKISEPAAFRFDQRL
ncbi:MAG: RES family NAD+ phosphorylase [Verrucomicrobiales bacterium]